MPKELRNTCSVMELNNWIRRFRIPSADVKDLVIIIIIINVHLYSTGLLMAVKHEGADSSW